MMNSNFKYNPDVTVLMSCYNGSKWLEEAIISVLNQTYKAFEFVLINDGSSDETWNIIQKYSKIDNRIVAINKLNSGLADSLNFGISIARGKWIARIDDDDLSEPNRLLEQFEYVQKNPNIVLLGSGFTEIDENKVFIKKHLYPRSHKQLLKNLERSKKFFPHSSAFYRTDVVKNIGGYNKRILRAEDRCLWLNIATIGEIACLSKPLVVVRKHSDQISLVENGRIQLCDVTAVEVCHFLKKFGYKDPSNELDINKWLEFRKWVEERIFILEIFQRQELWVNARKKYFNTKNKFYAINIFIKDIIHTGNFFNIFYEKIFGSTLPKKLAKEWILKI